MSHFKLIKLLKLLSKEEMFRLGKFLRSPFFNYTSSFISFYEILKKQYPDFEEKKWKPEKIWGKIFPAKPFHAQKFWRLCSDLSLLIEKYLIQLELENTDAQSEKLLIQAYSQRNAYSFFEKENQKRIAKLTALPFRDAEHYSEIAALNFNHFFHVQTPKHTLNDGVLEKLMSQIDAQFVLSKMRLASEFKNRERILKRQYNLHFLPDILQKGQSGFMEDNAVFQLYRVLFELYENPSEERHFFSLKNLLATEISNLRRLDQSLLLTQLINYGVQKINTGKDIYYVECLDLYKLGLDSDLVLENGQINEAVYGNIALLGCRAKEFTWTLEFIENYSTYLDLKNRADAQSLAKGILFFHQGDFEKAFDLLTNHSFGHFYQPKARLQLIKSLYELFINDNSWFDFMNSQIDAFNAFLRRNVVLSENKIKAHLNYLKITKSLIKIVFSKKNPSNFQKNLIQEIESLQPIISQKWLLKKAKELTK